MRMRGLFAASMFAMLASSNVAVAEPTGSTVQQGTASISSVSNGPGVTTTIDQTTDKAYIDWTSFDIGASDIVNFNQNTIQSIAVNRVTGGLGASAINGALNANGHVWILNPAGVAFGGTATVNVGGLLVTTADLDPTTFFNTAVDDAGGFTFTSGGNGTASVSNAGTINSGGLLALVAPFVDNSGTLTSSYGDVLLGGAEAFRISFSQVGRADPTPFNELLVTDFIIDTPVTNDPTPGAETVPVTNTGSITGANVIATAASVGGGAFINMDGVVEATSVGTQSGDIVLLAGGDFTGGAADASSGATDKIRVKNADLTAADDLVMQGTDVSIEKGTGPGTITAGAVRIEATSGDVTSDAAIETTTGAVDIQAFNLASLSTVDAKTTLDVTAKDIDLAGKLAAVGKITLDATDATKNISGTDIDIEGGSVELTGPVVATDSATIKAATGDVTINDNLTSSGTTTGSVLIEAKSGTATTAGLDATATTASGATIDVTADDVVTNGAVRADGAVTLTAETGDLLTHDTVTGASVDMEATLGDVVADDTITSTLGAVGIDAVAGLADLHAVDAKTTLDVTAKDIDLAGKLAAVGKITLDATDATKNISGTDIDIEGGSVELTGPVVATDSATIKAATGDATLNNAITSTGSILIEATSGKASVKGVDADTTTEITAKEIDLDGLVNGDTSVTLDATDATKDISGTDIHITGGSVDVTGKVAAIDSATIEATTTDVTLNDDLTSTGSVLIKALLGKVTAAGLSAVTTLEVYAREIMISGDAIAGGDVTIRASDGDATLSGNTESTGGNVDVEANLGTASVFDVASHLATKITGGVVKVLGDLVSEGQATLQALTGNVEITGSVTANGGLLLLNAAQGDAVINKIASTTNVSIQALDLDLSGSISAGDEVVLTSLDSGRTVVLGGDGGVGSFTLRKPQGLTIDAGELGRISAGSLKIDAGNNDALLRSVDFSGATLGDLSIGADASSWIMTDGIVTGLNSLTLGYIDGLDDRRPELVLIGGSLGEDSAGGNDWLGSVIVNSSQDIIIGSQTFKTYYDNVNPSLSQLGSLNPGYVGVASNHIFVAADNLELYAPGDIVQLNTGSGVDGKGLVFKVSAVGKAVLNPSGLGPEKVVLFGVVVRDNGTRVTSFSAGLEPRLLYEGEKDSNGNVISDPLTQTGDYHFNLCIIGDPVSCSNALLRQAEGTTAAALSDPNPNVLASGLTFDTGDDEDDDDDDTSGVAATGNESLWGAATQ